MCLSVSAGVCVCVGAGAGAGVHMANGTTILHYAIGVSVQS